MSRKARNTAVMPSKYYAKELGKIDPRFYVEKDIIAIVPYMMEEAQVPENAVIIKSSVPRKTIVVTQEFTSYEEINKSNNDYKNENT